MNKWKEKNEHVHVLEMPNLQILVHRKNHPAFNSDRWYLSVNHPPLDFTDFPLTPLDLNLAKEKAVELLFHKSDSVRNALQSHLQHDSKKVNSFRLKLIAMLDKAEYIQRDLYDTDKLKLDPLMAMIKSAIADSE